MGNNQIIALCTPFLFLGGEQLTPDVDGGVLYG